MLYYLFLLLLSPYVAWQDAPEAWQIGFQDPANIPLSHFGLIGTFSFHSAVLLFDLPVRGRVRHTVRFDRFGVFSCLSAILLIGLPIRGRVRHERGPLKIFALARRDFWGWGRPYWQFIVIDDLGAIQYMKTVHSRQLLYNPRYVDNELWVPLNRPFIVYASSLHGVQSHLPLPALGLDLVAIPNYWDIKDITISQPGVYCGYPYTETGYEGYEGYDGRVGMPFVVRAVPRAVHHDWLTDGWY